MSAQDDLGMDPAELQEFSANFMKNPENAVAQETTEHEPELDLPSGWEDDAQTDAGGSEDPSAGEKQPAADDDEEEVPLAAEAEDNESEGESETILTYKVNGKEVTLDLDAVREDPEAREKLKKDLALIGGAKKAVSKAGVLRRENRKLQKEAKELASYKDAWDRLEDIKGDEAQVFEVITGRSLDDVIAERAERQYKYQNASEEEKKVLEYEDRIRRMELENKREADRRARELERLEREKYNTDKRAVATDLKREAAKYDFEGVDPNKASRLRKMLWQSAVDDIKRYTKQGYKFNEKMIAKAFRDNASALEGFYKTSVERGVAKATQKRTKEATDAAAKAATKHYKRSDFNDLVGKNPLDIFHAFRKRK